jgi:hypothetical protein
MVRIPVSVNNGIKIIPISLVEIFPSPYIMELFAVFLTPCSIKEDVMRIDNEKYGCKITQIYINTINKMASEVFIANFAAQLIEFYPIFLVNDL